MEQSDGFASFEGDSPAAAEADVLPDRRELALVAIERTRMPMVVTNPRHPDNPIVLANGAFLELTGYGKDEILGRNCRFLQGHDTSPDEIDVIREAMANGWDQVAVELLNYRKDGSTFWNQLSISAVRDADGELLYYFGSQKDVTSRRAAQQLEASERRLLKEVDHRAMNALALVRSVVALSRADTIEHFSNAIKGRVDAIARAHRLLGQSNWDTADLEELLVGEVGTEQVHCSGPPTRLAPRLVQPLCLVFHELGTNARAHGALRRSEGAATVIWIAEPEHLHLTWVEEGVAIAPEPKSPSGLGLSLIRGTVEQQLGGKFSMTWQDTGISADIAIPWSIGSRS